MATSNLRRAELRLASEGQGLQKFFSVQGPVVPLKGGSPVTAFFSSSGNGGYVLGKRGSETNMIVLSEPSDD